MENEQSGCQRGWLVSRARVNSPCPIQWEVKHAGESLCYRNYSIKIRNMLRKKQLSVCQAPNVSLLKLFDSVKKVSDFQYKIYIDLYNKS